jgi:hypothetical protein
MPFRAFIVETVRTVSEVIMLSLVSALAPMNLRPVAEVSLYTFAIS